MTKSSRDAQIVDACTALFVSYARYVDFGEYDRFVELFTEDALLDLGFTLQGKAQIRRSMSKRDPELRSRHILTNISIDVSDSSHASGIAYLTLYRHVGPETLSPAPIHLGGPAGVGHYTNTFELTDAGWRIASCRLAFAFRNPAYFP